MSKTSGYTVRAEAWNVAGTVSKDNPDGRKVVAKIAVRNTKGQFHGATNFKGSVVG